MSTLRHTTKQSTFTAVKCIVCMSHVRKGCCEVGCAAVTEKSEEVWPPPSRGQHTLQLAQPRGHVSLSQAGPVALELPFSSFPRYHGWLLHALCKFHDFQQMLHLKRLTMPTQLATWALKNKQRTFSTILRFNRSLSILCFVILSPGCALFLGTVFRELGM